MAGLFDLHGKAALVTGGNRGIGLGIARGLAGAGAEVGVVARDQQQNAAACAELSALGVKAMGVAADVSARVQAEAAVAEVAAALGRLDIVVHCAGISRGGRPPRHKEEDWDAVVDLNLKAALFVVQAAHPHLVAAGGGKVITIGSEFSIFGGVNNPGYVASKGGIVQLTKGLASAWGRDNIQVNCILPGIIETALWGEVLQGGFRETMVRRTPAGRIGTPDDHQGIAVFLASAASDFVTGQAIAVDGGFAIADPLVFN